MAAITQIDTMDSSHIEKPSSQVLQVEHSDLKSTDTLENLVYNEADEEPELHARTYLALLAMFILNLVQVVALQGPPAVVRSAEPLNRPDWLLTTSSYPTSEQI